MISKATRDKIVAQALQELAFARRYKQGKVRNWQKNEEMYYGRKVVSLEARANVDLGRMQEFVHTLLSKIDNPLVFKFTKRKESQLKRVARLNALRQVDATDGEWDIKDLAGKKQAVIYGRTMYAYYADSYDEYCSHLENVDVYDFLVDPSGGGIDLENARYMGRYGVIKDKSQLKQGAKDGTYLKYETSVLLGGDGTAMESSQEETNKRARAYDTNTTQGTKEAASTTDKFKFWEWYTTYDGVRYYLLLQESGATAIRIVPLTELFPASKRFPRGAWPFWTWAAFPDLTEFWTPSYCDYVREIFMAQAVSINQALDNSEQINKPQKVVDVGAIEDLAQLKYRRDGYITTKSGTDVNKAFRIVETPAIETPLKVFQALENIQEKASGVTGASKGVSTETKVGIYEGDQANAADRFGLLNKSYSFGYRRFAALYELGVREHLTKRVAVDMIGPDGIETEEVSRRDIFRKGETFGLIVEASDAENQASTNDQKNKLGFLAQAGANPAYANIQNQKKAYEVGAKIAGFTEDEIKQLLDTSEYGNQEIISECEVDIEGLLEGKEVKPNRAANLAYKKHFLDYLVDHEDDMTHEQFVRLSEYLTALEPFVMKNTVRELNTKMTQMGAPPGDPAAADPSGAGEPALPIDPANDQNGPVPVQAFGA